MKKIILLLIISSFLAEIAQAQSAWLNDSRLSAVTLEWDKPLFDDRTVDRDEVSSASSSLFLTGHIRANDKLGFIAEIPVSHFGYETNNPFGGDDNSTVLGNIYLGGIWEMTDNQDNRTFWELGIRAPTTPDPNNDRFGSTTGLASEGSDRTEAFIQDTWSIPLIGNYITPIGDSPFAIKARLGTVYNIFTDDLKSLDNNMWLLYGFSTLYRESALEAHLGFSGRNQYVGNISGSDFWDTGFTQLRAGIGIPFQNVIPGIYVRKPLGDNYNQVLDFAYGLTLEIRR